MVRYSLFLVFLLFFTTCDKDKQLLSLYGREECQGINMVSNWYVVDSVEVIFLDIDSVEHYIDRKEMTLHENGRGVIDFEHSSVEDAFFRWDLQCDPDVFTMSIPFNSEDSLFSPLELYHVKHFEILINEINYKKMRTEYEGVNVIQEYKKYITTREIRKIK